MSSQGVNTAAHAHVPDFHRVVEGARDDTISLRVEVEAHDLCRVA